MINYIEEKATKLLHDANCFSAPVKVDKCAAFLNIELKPLKLDDDVSGFLLMNGRAVHIGYNESENKKRIRFTIAHEIAHYLLHEKKSTLFIDKSEKVLFRNLSSSTGEISHEREANAFAAALLMPKKLILQEIQKVKTDNKEVFIQKLSKKFDVSEQAITIRLNNLELIDYDAFSS
jgi:Zn-dependent peptidase ImmA (M78 family)